MSELWSFIIERAPELADKTIEHLLYLTALPLLISMALGVPAGILASRMPSVRGPLLASTGLVQTLPSLALLAFLLPLVGIGKGNAILALALYGLFPIVMNTVAGLDGVPASALEAARGLGFSPRQRLWLVELPLALPVMLAGIRTAAVINIGIATLATYVGAGGLGDFIQRGLAMRNERLILLGAGSAMLLALVVFFALGALLRLLPRQKART